MPDIAAVIASNTRRLQEQQQAVQSGKPGYMIDLGAEYTKSLLLRLLAHFDISEEDMDEFHNLRLQEILDASDKALVEQVSIIEKMQREATILQRPGQRGLPLTGSKG